MQIPPGFRPRHDPTLKFHPLHKICTKLLKI